MSVLSITTLKANIAEYKLLIQSGAITPDFEGKMLEDITDTLNELIPKTSDLIYQNAVATVGDLTTTYPTPLVGWASMVTGVGYIYAWNGTAWANTGLKAFPEDVAVETDLVMLDLSVKYNRTFDWYGSARNIVPVKLRNHGVVLQYQLNDLTRVQERYTGETNGLEGESWYLHGEFETVYMDGTVNDVQKEALNDSQFYINGVFNSSIYRVQKEQGTYDFNDAASPRNLVPAKYRRKGLIITYFNNNSFGITNNKKWIIERFKGDVISNPDFYNDSNWEFTENTDNVNNLADLRIQAYNTALLPSIDTIHFLVPDKMYFVKGRKLPFYRDSMFLESSKSKLNAWELSFNTETSDNEGYCHIMGGSINLDGNDVGAAIDLSIKKVGTTYPYYGKLISSSTIDAESKAGISARILMIGDSITNRYIPYKTKNILSSNGITATMLGTMTNLGGEKGEGREGWTLSNILGWENVHGSLSDNEIIVPSNSTVTTNLQNPFLKLADANDKLNYPDFCFRSTGAIKELSYSEDSNKTGNFYIFSFEKYVTTNLQGIAPDIVTIALGTNDSNKGYSGFYPDVSSPALLNTRYWKCLNFILSSITDYSHNIKIGVIPSYSRFDDYMWAKNSYSVGLIESTIKNVRTKNNLNINVVGVWNNVNRYYCSNGKLRTQLDSDMNVDTVSSNGDTLHYDSIGQSQISNSLACYIINML